jgi:putrescine transport system ATP-binding protein
VNLIEGTAAKTGEHAYEITYAEGVDPIKVTECEHEIAEGAKVTFAIRPEKIVVTQDPPEDRANAMQGKIIDIGYLGNLSTYHVELPGGQMVKATMTNASRISRRDYTWEDTVWLGFRSSAGVVLSE